MNYEEDAKYWLSFEDGSHVLVTAQIDKNGAVDLFNHDIDFTFFDAARYPNLDVVKA